MTDTPREAWATLELALFHLDKRKDEMDLAMIATAHAEFKQLRAELDAAKKELATLRETNTTASVLFTQYEQTIAELQKQVADLTRKVKALNFALGTTGPHVVTTAAINGGVAPTEGA